MSKASRKTAKVVYTPHMTESGERPINKLENDMEDTLLYLGFGRVEGNGNKIDASLGIYMHGNPGLFKRGFRYGKTLALRPKITDFVISTMGVPVLVEAKEQYSRGTAYEKIPYTVQSLQATGMPWALVYDGPFIPEPVVEHQRRLAKGDELCLGIIPFMEFEGWVKSLDLQKMPV